MKTLCVSVLCAACLAQASAPQPKTQTVPPAATAFVNELHDAYAAGNRLIIAAQLRTSEDCDRIRPGLEPASKQVTQVWTRENAAFVLELANAVSKCAPKEFWTMLSDGRDYVINRPAEAKAKRMPAPFGLAIEDDAFELNWHKAALAILLREDATVAATVYLDTLERRYITSPAAKAAHTTLDPRFMLMRGIVVEFRASSFSTMALRPASMIASFATSATDASHQSSGTAPEDRPLPTAVPTGEPYAPFAAAVKAFEQAAASDPAGLIAPEANVRLAAVLLASGKPADALAAIERAKLPKADSSLNYWASLWRGRILDVLNRPADAERAYQQALDVSPTGQAAAVGLALSLFKQNRRDEAVEAAARAQRVSPASVDPWWGYRDGDARFVTAWIDELRRRLR